MSIRTLAGAGLVLIGVAVITVGRVEKKNI